MTSNSEPTSPASFQAGPLAGRLIAIDVDGTLLGPDGTLAPETAQAVQAASAAGAVLTIATRPDWGLSVDFMEQMPGFSYGLCINGLEIRQADGVVLHGWSIDHDVAVQVITAARASVPGLSVGVGTSSELFGEPLIAEHMPLGVGEMGTVSDAMEAVQSTVRDLVFCHTDYIRDVPALIQLVREALHDIPGVEVAHTGLPMAEVVPEGTGKHTALAWLAERLGIEQASVIAVGDGMNDVSMLEWAGTAAVMGQAVDQVKKHADIVIGANSDHGLASYLMGLVASG